MGPTKKELLLATERIFQESIEIKQSLCSTAKEKIVEIAGLVSRAFLSKHRLFICGNGGSAADAQHLAAEFVNRFQIERPPLPAMALTVDTSILTSIANDYDFDEIFEKQLRALAGPGDVVLGLSTSGRSGNVLRALKWARENGIVTIGLGGFARTEMDLYCDLIVHVPSTITARVQECHIMIGHIICAHVDDMIIAGGEVSE
ncbi:MAG: SIS domain-containing protein [Deltaproteobacteria bacterium]|jgi:D-sedoheptulose 7-phosphate isomerase|nr:SIS domain-containing protein [Deltaproteobacteria bacterium]